MQTRHRCLIFALVGTALGLATNAWAQDPAAAAEISSGAWMELTKALGLPGVLGALGVWFGRVTSAGIPVSVRFQEEDRKVLRDLFAQDEAQ